MKTTASTKSQPAPVNRNGKTASRMMRASAPSAPNGSGAPDADAPAAPRVAQPAASAFIELPPSFIALADQFGMVPERLAERVISAFAATKPARIIVKARPSSGASVR
jgi:hypothetical protein